MAIRPQPGGDAPTRLACSPGYKNSHNPKSCV
jgi:hypothetical protein